MTIQRERIATVEQQRKENGPPPLSPAHNLLIEALADLAVQQLEPGKPVAKDPDGPKP